MKRGYTPAPGSARMSGRIAGIACLGLAGLIACGGAAAHHSFAALFDTSRTIELTGDVRSFEFKAPHAYIVLAVPDETGAAIDWQIETATPGMLIRKGITPESIRPGDRIAVNGNPTRDGRPLIRLLTITMPDGSVIDVQ